MPSKYTDTAVDIKENSARKSRRRGKDRSSSRERRPRSVSSTDDRGLNDHEGRKRRSKDHENSRVHERISSEPSLTGKTRSSRSSKPGRAATMPIGYRGIGENEPLSTNGHTGEPPLPPDSSYRPLGLAADYYGDQGESVADQPGVRPVAPSIILGPDTHLHEPTAEAAPPVEPSALGQVGAAASFYGSSSDLPDRPQQSHGNGKPAARPGTVPYDHPSPRASPGPTPSPGTALPASSGMNASYYSSAAFAEGVDDGGHNRPNSIPQASASHSVPQQHYEHPSKPAQGPTSNSISPWAGVAAASGAYALYSDGQHDGQSHGSHGHHEPGYPNVHGYATGQGSQASLMGSKHRRRGPLSRIVNFFKDPEAVGQYEEYTEVIGVCKYCFEPGSSPRDAPRKHYYKRRLSGGSRYGSSTRVDKLNRYASSDEERRKKSHSKAPLVAAGIAGYGLAQAGKSFANRKDFDDTYSVRSGRPIPNEIRHSRRSHDQDHLQRRSGHDQTEYGVAHASSHAHSGHPQESHSVPLHGSSEAQSQMNDRHSARRSSPRRSKPARISPRGSYVSLKSDGPSGYTSFFSAPSANQKSQKRKKKGFFTLHNSSSSSSDLDLAFGTGHVRGKNSKRGSRTRKDEFDLNGTMLGLGAATAALAAANSRSGRNKNHRADLVAVKEARPKRGTRSERHRRGSPATSESGADSVWEDASDDESDRMDSDLAYGLATRHSRDSLDSNDLGKGTDKWAWRWGGKRSKSARTARKSRPSHDHRSPSRSPERRSHDRFYPSDRPTESSIRPSSLQQVYPVPTSDPTMFDVARNSSNNSAQPQAFSAIPFVSQAASVPLKQPQPFVPATSVLNGDQGSRMAPFRQSLSRDNTARQSSIASKPGRFLPEEIISESPPHVQPDGSQGSKNTSKRVSWSTEEPLRMSQRIPQNVPTDRPYEPYEPKGSEASGRRATARERSSTVTFDLPDKEFEREQRANRRRSERRRADSYGSDHTHPEVDRPRRRRHSPPSDDEHVKDSVTSDTSTIAPRRRSEENLAREEELEREIRQLVEADQSQQTESKKSSTSWVAPAAIGAAGAGFAAVAAHVMSKSEETDMESRQAAEKNYSETPAERGSARDGYRTETATRRQRRSGKIKLPRSTSSPVHDDYGSYFTPPELSEHLEEHNVASKRRNSADDRSATVPQIVEVIPGSPSKFPVDLYVPFGSRAEHNAERLYQPIPRLNLMEPSPPVSIAGSVRGDETPMIIAVEPRDEPLEELEDVTVHAAAKGVEKANSVYSMEDESESPRVDRSTKPSNFSHQPQAQANPPSDEPMSPRTKDIPIYAPSEDYGMDIGFAAALAAGVQDAGFDPSIVIDDPVYHKRDSPPGIDRDNLYQAPFAETVSDLGIETRSNPLPPIFRGFVEGEIESPVTERESAIKDPRPLGQNAGEEKSRALEKVVEDSPNEVKERAAPREQQQAFDPKVPGDFNVFDYFEGESPAAAEPAGAEQRNFDSLPAEEALSRVSWSSHKAAEESSKGENNQNEDAKVNGHGTFDRTEEQNKDGNEVGSPVVKTKSQEEPEDFYSSSSRKKSRRKSKRESATILGGPHDFGDIVEEATRSQPKSKHRNDEDDKDDISVAASAPGVDELNETARSKKKSKRDSRTAKRLDADFDDAVSTASSPAKISNEKDPKSSGKDKRSSGIFSMFGALQALSTQKDSQPIDEETRTEQGNDAGSDEFEIPMKKSKMKSKKGRARDSVQEATEAGVGTISSELPPSPKDEANSFLDERPEMPLKDDIGASGPSFNSTNSESDRLSLLAQAESRSVESKPNLDRRSRSASPGSAERDMEVQSVPFIGPSSPSTPQSRNALAQRRLSALQIGESSSHTLTSSSPTAIPLTFRRPPISPGHSRHGSATSPSNESRDQGFARSRQPRPHSTEFKFSKEFRPLFLVERHSYKHEPRHGDLADTYPSLPSSRTSSAHPSIEDLREIDQADNAMREPPDSIGQPPKGDKRHSWSGFRSQSPKYLDSQETTPTAAEFPSEVKKPKHRYEFHSPSELLQSLPSQKETEESTVSPMLLPKNMSSESLDHFGQQTEEMPESSHSPRESSHTSPAQSSNRKASKEPWKAIGFAAAAGVAGTAVAEMISSSPQLVAAQNQERESYTMAEEPVSLADSRESGLSAKVVDDAVTSLSDRDDLRKPFSLKSPPARESKKSKKKKRSSVGFANISDKSQLTPEGSSPQNSYRSQEATKSLAVDPTYEVQNDESEQPLSQDIPPLSLDTTNISADPEQDVAEFSKPEESSAPYPHDSSGGNRHKSQSSSPHVHWPEGSSAAQSLEYDPSRSTQNLVNGRGNSIDNTASGIHEESRSSHLEQSARWSPESIPLPVTDDSDLLEPLSLEFSGANGSPLSIAFERAKAARGLPREVDLKHQDEALPADEFSERHRQLEVRTTERTAAASHVPSTVEDLDFTPTSTFKKGRENKKIEHLPPDQSDEITSDINTITGTEQLELRGNDQEVEPSSVSRTIGEAAAKDGTELESEPKDQSLDTAHFESASSPERRDSLERATESVIQDLSNARPESSTNEETMDGQNVFQETTEESLWPVLEKKSKKKKAKGRSSLISAEDIALQPKPRSQTSDTVMSSETIDVPMQTPAFQEEPEYTGKEVKPVLEAADKTSAEPRDDPIDWVPAGKKGKKSKKGKGKQRADSLLGQPFYSPPQNAKDLDPLGSSSNVDSKAEENRTLAMPSLSSTAEDLPSDNLVHTPEPVDSKDTSPDYILEEEQQRGPTATVSSTTQFPTDTQLENPKEEEQDDMRRLSSDLVIGSKQPDEDAVWAPIIKGKKSKKKSQMLEAKADDTPTIESIEEHKLSTSEESPAALEARPSLSRKQSKKEKRKKKAFVKWDDDGVADVDHSQSGEAAANEGASVPTEVDETLPTETVQRVVSPTNKPVEIDDSLAAEPTKAKNLDNEVPQDLQTEPAVPTVDRDVFEDADVPPGGSNFISEGNPATDAVYHDTDFASTAEAADKVKESSEPTDTTVTESNQLLPESSVAQDVGIDWPVSLKRSKKDKKKNKKQSTAETLRGSTSPEIKALPPDTQATLLESIVDADLAVQQRSQDKADSVEPVEPDWLDTMGKKSKKKKKKRQTIDWAEEPSQLPMTLSAGQQPEATVTHGSSTLDPEFTEQTIRSPLSRELQDFPLETPRRERSDSILWALPAESVTETKPTEVSEALREEIALRETTDLAVFEEDSLPTPINQHENEAKFSAAEEDVSIAEPLQDVDAKVSKPDELQATAEHQPVNQNIPISATSEALQNIPTGESVQETPAKEPLEAPPSVTDDRAPVEKISEADLRDTDKTEPLAEEATDFFWAATSKKAKKDKKKKKTRLTSTISSIETPAEGVPSLIPQSETQMVPDPLSDDERYGAEEAYTPEADEWNELPKKSKKGRKRAVSSTHGNAIELSTPEQSVASPVQLGEPSSASDRFGKQQETPVEDLPHNRLAEGEEHVQRELGEISPGIMKDAKPENDKSKISTAAEDDIMQAPWESAISQEPQIEKTYAKEDLTAKEQGKVADADNSEEAATGPEPETISEEFSWVPTSKKEKRKKRKTSTVAANAEPEHLEKLVPGKSTLGVQQTGVEQTVEEVGPEESAWTVPIKKGKKQKTKTKSLMETAAIGGDVLESDQSRPDDDKTSPMPPARSISDAQAEDLWQAPVKKDKKSKKKNRIVEDNTPTPIVLEDVGTGQDSEEPPRSLTQGVEGNPDHTVSVVAPLEDGGWATSGKKGKKGKKKKQPHNFEDEIVESSTPTTEEKSPSREHTISYPDLANDDVRHQPPEKNVEIVTEEELEKRNLKNITEETLGHKGHHIGASAPQAFDKFTDDLDNNGEAVRESVRIGDPGFLNDAATSANEEIATAVDDTQPEDNFWSPGATRKQSKKDRKKKRNASTLVLSDETQPQIAKQETQEESGAHGHKLPTPQEPLMRLPEHHPSRELLSEDSRSRSVDAPDPEYEPSIRSQSPMRGGSSQGPVDVALMEHGQEVASQVKDSERRHSDHFDAGEDLLVSRSISQDVVPSTEVGPEFALSLKKRKKDRKNTKGQKTAIESRNEPTSITETSSRSLGTYVEANQELDGFKPAHHVKPSIQKAIQTLEGTQRRSSIPKQRSSSPSATRSFRDSAMQMLESPHVEEPLHQVNRDSGYIPSPVIPGEAPHHDEQAAAQITGRRPLRPITPTSSSEDLKNESTRTVRSKRSMTGDMSRPTSAQSQEEKRDLKVEVEVSPDYEILVHQGSNDGLKHRELQSVSSPPLSPRGKAVTGFPETPIRRKPSQIDSTSKDRSSGLFDSSPSLRTPDPGQTPQSNRKNQSFEASGLHRSPSVHSRRSAELLKQRDEHENGELSTVDKENDGGQEGPSSHQSRSIFGGPFENEPSDQRGLSPSRMTLGTIHEDASSSQQEKFNDKGKRPHGSPSKGDIESLPLEKSWPKLDEEHEAARFSPQPPSKPIGGEPPATPEDSEDENARDAAPGKGAKGLGKRTAFPTSADLRDADFAGLASSSTRDPVTGAGNEATRKMADSYVSLTIFSDDFRTDSILNRTVGVPTPDPQCLRPDRQACARDKACNKSKIFRPRLNS